MLGLFILLVVGSLVLSFVVAAVTTLATTMLVSLLLISCVALVVDRWLPTRAPRSLDLAALKISSPAPVPGGLLARVLTPGADHQVPARSPLERWVGDFMEGVRL